MNKTFKVVFNRARQGLMVANEITSSVQKKGTKTVLAAAAASLLASGLALAADYPAAFTWTDDKSLPETSYTVEFSKDYQASKKNYSAVIEAKDSAKGTLSNVSITANAAAATLGKTNPQLKGLLLRDGVDVTLDGESLAITMTTDTTGGGDNSISGISTQVNDSNKNDSTKLTISADTVTISSTSTNTNGKSVYAIDTYGGIINFTGKTVTLTTTTDTEREASDNQYSETAGLVVGTYGKTSSNTYGASKVTFSDSTNLVVNVTSNSTKATTVTNDEKSDRSGGSPAFGVKVDGGTLEAKGSTTITVNSNGANATGLQLATTYYASTVGKQDFSSTATVNDLEVNATTQTGKAFGIRVLGSSSDTSNSANLTLTGNVNVTAKGTEAGSTVRGVATEAGTISFTGEGKSVSITASAVKSDDGNNSRAINASSGGTINLGIIGENAKKLKSVTVVSDSDADFTAQIHGDNTKLNVNAETYTQTGSGHGIYVRAGAALTMNVDEFNSTTAYTAIHTRESANSKAEVTAKTFTATTTTKEAGVALLQVNEGSSLKVTADTATLTGSDKLGGGVLGTGTYGTLTLDTKNLSMTGNINGTYGLVNNKGCEAKFDIKATESLNLTGNINVGSLKNSSEVGSFSNFSRNTTVSVDAGKATIVGDINVWENTSDKTNTDDVNTVTLKLGNGSTITGNISVIGKDGSTSSSATDAKNTVTIEASGTDLTFTGDITATNGGSVTLNGGLYKVNTLTITKGLVTLSKGTLQTTLAQVFGNEAKWTSESLEKVSGLTLESGSTLSLTDGETYTSGFLSTLKKAAGKDVVLSFVNAKLKLVDTKTATLIDNVIQETTTVTVKPTTTDGVTTATIGNATTEGSTGAVTTGAQTIELESAAAVSVAASSNVTLVGKTDGSSFIENATALTVANNATLNLGSINSSEATTGVLPELTLNQGSALNVTNTNVTTTALTVAEGASNVKISVGSTDSAGSLHADTIKLNNSIIFVDPAWTGNEALDLVEYASYMTVGSVGDEDLNGTIVAGQNSVLALGATKDTAAAGFNKIAQNSNLTWGENGTGNVTAALYIGQPITLTSSTKILVDGSLSDLTSAESAVSTLSGVKIASKGLLMVDQVAVGNNTAISGTLSLADGSYIGLVNATGETLTLASTVTLGAEGATVNVVTDNPFVTAELSSNTITSTVNATTGLQALASTGIQAMTRRADSILAQTIADRTSVDQELGAGANLWVDVAGETYEADKLDNNASFKADMGYGAFGGEFGIGDTITAGAAIQYGKGSLRSSVSSIKNKIDSYGATIYGTMKFGESKVVADIAYVKNTNDITSSQSALNQKPDTQMYSIGVRGQHRFTAGNFQIVPSVGVRVSRLETDAMTIGSVKVKKQKQNIVQVPIALRINGMTQNAAGWAVSPSFKVAYVPTFGDKEITALGADQTVIDTSPVQADFGIRAQKGNLMLNANFMAGTGNDGASSIGGKVGLKYVF